MNLLRILLSALTLTLANTASASDQETEREGGILGTGILGTITELGSIYVNGQHIRFAPDFAVTDGITVTNAHQLRPGHTVAVIATPGEDAWQASYIRQIIPLVGPVQSVSSSGFKVMGTTVLTNGIAANDLNVGDWVAVSGLWQSGHVIASRVETTPQHGLARIEGSVLDLVSGQPLTIGGTRITGLLPRHIQEGDVVRAVGTASRETVQVTRLDTGVFSGEPQIVLSEGFFSAPRSSGFYTLLGSDIVSYTSNPAMIDPASKQFVCSSKGEIFSVPIHHNQAQEVAAILENCISNAAE
ncbi:DUF5666 domain-containing protein [Shimia sp. CNT1-13L.2]|uniref:DUF5666 domain-containing protein n=1 Tax=Shimia sp. CNT1-13L.2 TaxID=2959663 RepID=UPI0020CB88D4|nr:DUF5666 domain-containing protein [Shimia sp. CNT1-13L.2]MCP9484199.1 DUF5666 domain-containing protein [Shimia sp. CNT1-13L.2]